MTCRPGTQRGGRGQGLAGSSSRSFARNSGGKVKAESASFQPRGRTHGENPALSNFSHWLQGTAAALTSQKDTGGRLGDSAGNILMMKMMKRTTKSFLPRQRSRRPCRPLGSHGEARRPRERPAGLPTPVREQVALGAQVGSSPRSWPCGPPRAPGVTRGLAMLLGRAPL